MLLWGPLLTRLCRSQCDSWSRLTFSSSSLCAIGEMTTWAPISGTFPHFGMSTLPYWPSSIEPTQHYFKLLDGLILLWDSLLDGYVTIILLYRLSKGHSELFLFHCVRFAVELLSELKYGTVHRRLWKSQLLLFFYLSGTPT